MGCRSAGDALLDRHYLEGISVTVDLRHTVRTCQIDQSSDRSYRLKVPDNASNLTNPPARRNYPKVQIRRLELTPAKSFTLLQCTTARMAADTYAVLTPGRLQRQGVRP